MNFIPRERIATITTPQNYAPTLREYNAKYTPPGGSGVVPDPGTLTYENEQWEVLNPSDDQRLKLALKSTVGQQYVLAGIQRTPRITFLVANPHVPSREKSPGSYETENALFLVGAAKAINDIPATVRRDRSRTFGD
jgi:hypothetical protein